MTYYLCFVFLLMPFEQIKPTSSNIVGPLLVRKLLQGLDYFAADGAQAFDTLISVVRQLSEFGADSNWEATTIDS